MPANQSPKTRPRRLEPEERRFTEQREEVLKRLEATFPKSTGKVLRLLKQMHEVLASTRPNSIYKDAVHKQAVDTFLEILKEMRSTQKVIEVPAVFEEANQFVADHGDRLRARLEKAGVPLAPKPDTKADLAELYIAFADVNSDGMAIDKGKPLARSLGAMDAAPDEGAAKDERKVPEELKNWVNPALGRLGR